MKKVISTILGLTLYALPTFAATDCKIHVRSQDAHHPTAMIEIMDDFNLHVNFLNFRPLTPINIYVQTGSGEFKIVQEIMPNIPLYIISILGSDCSGVTIYPEN